MSQPEQAEPIVISPSVTKERKPALNISMQVLFAERAIPDHILETTFSRGGVKSSASHGAWKEEGEAAKGGEQQRQQREE